MNTEIDWARIGRELAAPLDPTAVSWRIQGRPEKNARRQLVPYVDARVVAERLDEAVGVGAWSFTYTPLVVEGGELRLAQGSLSIHGVVKQDIGDASNFEASKGCISDCLKRCAVLWGVARYLYSLPDVWVTLDGEGHIADTTLAKLRERLAARAA